MNNSRKQHIQRAKELLRLCRHAAMATVNADGTPHNTPFLFLHSADLTRVYWGSHPNSLHSGNVTRRGQAFFVLFDAVERGGLYIEATNAHQLDGKELAQALLVHNAARANYGQGALSVDYYTGTAPQRMWSAAPVHFWVNGSKRDAAGHVEEDIREEVTASELLY